MREDWISWHHLLYSIVYTHIITVMESLASIIAFVNEFVAGGFQQLFESVFHQRALDHHADLEVDWNNNIVLLADRNLRDENNNITH
uniref:Uncharacterized protein n=1 Tax=Steinernema glaseri TaxID=37863 RepID=A0A1I7Z4J1_9BILA